MYDYLSVIDLNGEWLFFKEGEESKYPVTVPGSVLSGLLSNKLIEDPFVGINEYKTRELFRNDYTFEKTFIYENDKSLFHDIVFDGINTLSTVYLNGKEILSTENMHRRYVVNVDKQLVDGENTLVVKLKAPIEYIESYVPARGKEIHFTNTGSIFGNQYIRQAHSQFGWDWGPQLPDMGIWKSVYIRAYKEEVLDYVKLHTEPVEEGKYKLLVSGILRSHRGRESKIGFGFENKKYCLLVTVCDPDGNEIVTKKDASEEIIIENAKLWWPNGLGEHPLYTVKATLVDAKSFEEENSITERIGLRTFTISRENDEFGQEFAFKINGVKIFSKGADYIPEDCVYSRITKEKSKELIDSCVSANFNTIRVWGGGYYPYDEFYELCDEAGIIIWQDFMFACNVYELTRGLEESIEEEVRDNVRRLRNHASLGFFCGNNECESAWVNWGDFKDHSRALKADYIKMFENIIPKTLEKEDGDHFYWPSSPSSYGSFEDPDADNVGDRHYWDVWHGEKPFTDYEKYFFRFCSEFGFQSFPEMATIKTFAKEGDFNIFSEVMESHQKNGTANAKILRYISENFLYPKDFESLLYISQVLQAMAIKYGVEHWRRNRGRSMGTLYWQLNDNWPVASWASIDYFGRWKALHYEAKKFYQNVMGSVQRNGFVFTPFVSNETFSDVTSHVKFLAKTMTNEVVFSYDEDIEAKSLGVGRADGVDVSSAVKGREHETYLEVIFEHSDGTVSKQVEPMCRYKHMQLPKAEVQLSVRLLDEHTVAATLSSDSFAAFAALMCEERKIIWDDNFFFITNNNEFTVIGKCAESMEKVPDIKLVSVCDTFEK